LDLRSVSRLIHPSVCLPNELPKVLHKNVQTVPVQQNLSHLIGHIKRFCPTPRRGASQSAEVIVKFKAPRPLLAAAASRSAVQLAERLPNSKRVTGTDRGHG
jgi:hypothetical protein